MQDPHPAADATGDAIRETAGSGIPTPPDGGKIPPPRLPPGPRGEDEPDLGPTGPRSPRPEHEDAPVPDMPPGRQPGIPTGPGGHG